MEYMRFCQCIGSDLSTIDKGPKILSIEKNHCIHAEIQRESRGVK